MTDQAAKEEIKRLQSCVNDLIGLQALAGVWLGQPPPQMVGTLLEALMHLLRLDVAYAHIGAFMDAAPYERLRLAHSRSPEVEAHLLEHEIPKWLEGKSPRRAMAVADPFGEAELWIATLRLGLRQEIGVLVVGSQRPDFPTPIEWLVLRAAANQALVALQEARRLGEQRQLATLQERQRLSRELHDSVSQALYGIALGARTARNRVEREPLRAVEPLENVLALTDTALTEMRALIFELRPEALQTEGLVAALQKHAGYVRARYNLPVATRLCAEPSLPPAVNEALYRIAQEALQNTLKHAHAAHAELELARTGDTLALTVRDDGTGFDPSQTFAGHLGLHTMRERAAQIGGRFTVESAPAGGTVIRVELTAA